MKFSKYLNTKFFYQLLSLVFAIFLFIFVNSAQFSPTSSGTSSSMMSNNKSVTIKMPVKIKGQSSDEFISGVPNEVEVRLIGPSAQVTAANNTKNFEVYIDVTGLKRGTHQVKLEHTGLNREVGVKFDPETVKIKIATKKVKTFPVQVRYNSDNIADGFLAGTPKLNYRKVTVVGAKHDINNIAMVVANVNLPYNIKENFSGSVFLEALDKNGKVLDVDFEPETVKVSLPIYTATASKKVSINLIHTDGQKGYNYQLSSDTKSVVLHGTKQALDNISVLNVPVSVAGITSTRTKTIQVQAPVSGILSISPATITVEITVLGNDSNSESEKNDNDITNNLKQDNQTNHGQNDTSVSNGSTSSSSSSMSD